MIWLGEIVEEALLGYGYPTKFVQLIMVCISSLKFSVKVNGVGHGYFEGKRGLRQGDPMSPLLFVLVMEYFSRLLSKMSELPDFRFHPMYKKLKLTHLIFADDLMIFCKGQLSSVKRVMEALDHFSATTGLIANLEKSSLFMDGMNAATSTSLLEYAGFSLGEFPIRYPGYKKWNKIECHQLNEKITARIKTIFTRHLSYAGRLQIINVVLFSLHNFWGSVFILPECPVRGK